jgi:hypothetical protein
MATCHQMLGLRSLKISGKATNSFWSAQTSWQEVNAAIFGFFQVSFPEEKTIFICLHRYHKQKFSSFRFK